MVKSKMQTSHSTKLALTLFLSSFLSGCALTDAALDDDIYQPYGGSDMHPLTVVKAPVTLEISSAHGTLQPLQINAVIGFVHQAMQAGVTPITIAQPSGAGNSARVASEVASLMVQQGVPSAYVRFATYQGGASSPVRLTYVSTYGQSLKCGQWPDDATDTAENQLTTNHGCAVQANIAAEIAYPGTLLVPATVTPIPAEPVVAGVTNALTGPAAGGSTTTSTPSATGGAKP